MDGFGDDFYDLHYSMAPSGHPSQTSNDDNNHVPLVTYATPDPMHQAGHFAYQTAALGNFMPMQSAESSLQPTGNHTGRAGHINGQVSNAMMAYGPLSAGSSMSMPLQANHAFAYDNSTYRPTTTTLDHSFDQHTEPRTSLNSHHIGIEPTAAYSTAQMEESITNMFWGHSQPTEEVSHQHDGSHLSDFPQSSASSQDPSYKRTQEARGFGQSSSSSSASSHRVIRPKWPSPLKSSIPSRPKPEPTIEGSKYANIYSNTGFDMMSILAEVVSRPNPKINIGAVDMSCAFVLCDIMQEDHPIVYVSESFERLTGYSEKEIVGQNCRFLQGPNGTVERGGQRKFVDENTAFRLRSTIEDRGEIQASIINYRKGGQAFMNLITMIPIRFNSSDYRFYVGFQVDLVERPEAVTRRNPNGTYMINYQRNQLPNYVVPPSDIHQTHPELVKRFPPEQVTLVLNSIGNPDQNYQAYLDRVLVESTDDIIHVLSFEGEFQYVSQSCRDIMEYEPFELVGKTLSTICHPSDIGPVIRDLRSCTTTEPVSVVYRARKKHSGYIWLESHGSWHINERGRQYMIMVARECPVYCLNQIGKIGQGGLAENDVWAKVSMTGIILFISMKIRPVLGRTPDELMGKSLQDLIDVQQEAQQSLEKSRQGQQASFPHRMRHKKGHMLPAQTTLFPGDTQEGVKPSFLVAQIRFPKPSIGEYLGETDTIFPPVELQDSGITDPGGFDFTNMGPNQLPSGNQHVPTIRQPPSLFSELSPTRGSSWQLELRELEKQNRTLSDEVQRLLARRKKRKRKQTTALMEKACAMCTTKNTPEWRRGPSGNRDLCNSCGLRWAKQVRNAAQPATVSA